MFNGKNKIPLGHDITEILLKVALNTITPLGQHTSVDVTSKVLWQLSRNQHCKIYEKESLNNDDQQFHKNQRTKANNHL